MADKNNKLVYATSDQTVHVTQGTVDNQFGSFEVVEGRNLAAGETYPLAKLAKYQQEAIEAGEAPGLDVVTEKEAAERKSQMDKLRAVVAAQRGNQNFNVNQVLGDDGSFSDHLVSDAQRIANHVAQAGGDTAGVAQSDSDDASVYAGVETDSELVDKVVKQNDSK